MKGQKMVSGVMLGMLLLQTFPMHAVFATEESATVEATPLQTENTSSESEDTPLQTENTSSESEDTPLQAENTSSESEDTPLQAENTSSEGEDSSASRADVELTSRQSEETQAEVLKSGELRTPDTDPIPAPTSSYPGPNFTTDTEIHDIRYYDETNPNDGIIIMDRNLGAITNDIDSAGSYGFHYQWGNNHGFTRKSNESADFADGTDETTGATQVANPEMGYTSGAFIRGIPDRASPQNNNLRGGAGDSAKNNYGRTPTNPIDRQGPCPTGYHVPSYGEWIKLLQLFAKNEGREPQPISEDMGYHNQNGSKFMQTFKLPFAGIRNGTENLGDNHSVSDQGSYGLYRGSSALLGSAVSFFSIKDDFDIRAAYDTSDTRTDGLSIRCFKNSYTPPQTFHLLFSGQEIELPVQKIFEGKTGTKPADPTRAGYDFKGWFTDEGYAQEFDFNQPITAETTVYAKWQITADYLAQKQTEAKVEIDALSNLSTDEKNDYKNQVDSKTTVEDVDQIVNNAKDKDAQNKAKTDNKSKSPSYSGGGGSGRYLPSTSRTPEKPEPNAASAEKQVNTSISHPTKSSIDYLVDNAMTPITRGDLARMIIFLDAYGVKINKPRTNTGCVFEDRSSFKTGEELAAQKVCEWGVMGIQHKTKDPIASFNPRELLSYNDFVTILGRIIFGYIYQTGDVYYEGHKQALKKLNILGVGGDGPISLYKVIEQFKLLKLMQ